MHYFLLPMFNEESDLPRVFDGFVEAGFTFDYRIVAVNDGSIDRTAEIVKENKSRLNIQLIEHDRNLGMGKAIESGLAYIFSVLKPGDIVITMDADGTQPLELAEGITAKIRSGYNVVVASRFMPGSEERGVNIFRKLLSHSASAVLKLLRPVKNVSDYSSGYRGFSSEVLLKMRERFNGCVIEEIGFSATLEILLKASLVTDKFAEMPMALKYDMKKGRSKMKIFNTIIAYVFLFYRLNRLSRGPKK